MSAAAILLLDTGPWVALHCRDDGHHAWAKEQFGRHSGPFLTCEAVVAETCFLLARAGHDPAKALALIERGAVQIGMNLADENTRRPITTRPHSRSDPARNAFVGRRRQDRNLRLD